MAFSITEIKGALKQGGARPTLFNVELFSPFQSDLNTLSSFMVQSAQLPGSSITPIEVPYFGRKIRVAGDRTFEPWTVTIINDEDFKIRHALETWHHRINTLVGNLNSTGSPAPDNYKKRAAVHQYSKVGDEPIRTYQFEGMFPTEITPIELNWNDTDQIEIFQVTFVYDYFEVTQARGPAAGRTIQG
jgi:hypothetical protein